MDKKPGYALRPLWTLWRDFFNSSKTWRMMTPIGVLAFKTKREALAARSEYDKRTHTPAWGSGAICPRCEGPKPTGEAGGGISLSRRGRAFICANCGTEEAMLDSGLIKATFGNGVKEREARLRAALAATAGKTEGGR